MVAGCVLLNLFLALFLLWGRTDVARFLRETSRIDGVDDMNRFKTFVRRQMYAALVYIPFAMASLLGAMYLGATQGVSSVPVVLTVCGASFLFAMSNKKLEVRARSLPVNERFKAEYTEVGEAWVKKALPAF